MQPVDLNHAVEELVRMFKETFPRNIDLQTDLQHALPWVQADGNQLQQIVMNLCVNARDAMPGGGRLLLRTCERPGTSLVRMGGDPHLTYASLEVCDSGHGMSPEVLARIFEPFYTTKEKNSGTGLGLAVVYGIVTGHGGLLDVQSVPGRGTTFFVHLPFPQTGAACVADVSEEGGGVPPGTERILVVEDEPGVRGLFTTAFGEAGYRVSTAADGAAAVEMLLGSPAHFDAVLLDLNLPRIDGLQVLTAVRRERPGAAVVIVSGHVTPEVRTELERAGDTEIVCKPCGLGELGRAVRRVLARVPA